MQKYPQWLPRIVYANFQTLGSGVARIMRSKLEPVRFKGTLARSVNSEMDLGELSLSVGPTAAHAPYVFYGTKPHWAPIAPLKEWCRWKFGDERAAWAVQRSIAKYGTNRGYAKRGLKGAWQSSHGIGFDFLRLTTEDGRFSTLLTAAARRLGMDFAAYIVGKERS